MSSDQFLLMPVLGNRALTEILIDMLPDRFNYLDLSYSQITRQFQSARL